jgi:hypothetical protein
VDARTATPPPDQRPRLARAHRPRGHQGTTRHRRRARRPAHGCDPLDEHRDLVRLKVAGTLAVLDDRDDINPEDWSLARMVVDLSGTTRGRVLATLAEEAKRVILPKPVHRSRHRVQVPDGRQRRRSRRPRRRRWPVHPR